MMPLTCLSLLQRTDLSALGKEKCTPLGLLVLKRDQNRLGTLPVELAVLEDFFLHLHPRGVRCGIGGGRRGLGPYLFVGLCAPYLP